MDTEHTPHADAVATALDLALPAPCVEGVEANARLLADHWRILSAEPA